MGSEAKFESPDISGEAAHLTRNFEAEEAARAWNESDRKNNRAGAIETSIGIVSLLIAADLLVVNPEHLDQLRSIISAL